MLEFIKEIFKMIACGIIVGCAFTFINLILKY